MSESPPARRSRRRLLVALPVATLAGGGGGVAYAHHQTAALEARVVKLEQSEHDREQRAATMREVDDRLRGLDQCLGPGPKGKRP